MEQAEPGLVDADWLKDHLGDPGVVVIDCTTYMYPQPVGPSRVESGRPSYDEGHIPGARYASMVDDLSDPAGEFPYTLLGPEQFEALMSRLGISADDHVVLYGRSPMMTVTRAWYVMKALGHRRVSILDGGWDGWLAAGGEVSTESPAVTPTAYAASPQPDRAVDAEQVRAVLGDSQSVVVNALSPEQHAGTGGAHYGRPGRIPGSVSVPAMSLLDETGQRWKPRTEIESALQKAGVRPDRRTVTYCGGGIAATVAAFALDLTGHPDWAVYDNSLLEWSADPSNPMETDSPE